jgi:PAS domain S-box-containing protein
VVVFFLLAAAILASGAFYLRAEATRQSANVENALSAVADLKTQEITRWRAERLASASLFVANEPFSALVERLLAGRDSAAARAQLVPWLSDAQVHLGYDQVTLLDAQGHERLALPEGASPVYTGIPAHEPDVLRSGTAAFEDFYRSDRDGRVYLSVLVPILDRRGHGLALLAFRIDPGTYLYPLIQRWPTPSRSAETLLVRRDGDSVVFLNELRFQPRAALTALIPLSQEDLPAAQAVRGKTGIVTGNDYRGVAAVAALRKVPGSPWFLVARIDRAEADAPLRSRLWSMVILVGGLLVAAAAAVRLVWREQRVKDLRKRYLEERGRAWLHEVVARSLNEVYVFDPESFRFLFANRGACRNIGYSQEELARLTLPEIKPQFSTETFRAMLEPLRGPDRPLRSYKSVHRRKDGSEYPVEVQLQLVDSEPGPVFLAMITDISERVRADRQIHHLNRVYRTISAINQLVMRSQDPSLLFAEACRTAVETGGYRMAWVGRRDPELNHLWPATWSGVVDGYLDGLPVGLDAMAPARFEPAQRVLRNGTLEVCNDIAADSHAAGWRDDALSRGYRSSATLPLIVNGATVAAFTLFSEEAGSFDHDELHVLAEVASDLSFALEVAGIHEAQHRLATAIEQAPISVYIAAADGRILYTNPAFTRMTGYSSEEALGANPRILKSGKQDPALYREMWATIGAGRSWQGEVVNRRRDGTLYTQELTIAPVREGAGTVTAYIALGKDVTSQRQAEEALRNSEERYRAVADSANEAIVTATLDGIIVGWNKAAELTFGYSASETLGLPLTRLIPERWREEHLAGISRVRSGGEGRIIGRLVEVTALHKDGSEFPVELSLATWEAAEGFFVTAMLRDISARKNLEAQLVQSQKLEAVGQLAGGVAHDFNNLLGVITGYGELALRQLDAGHPVRSRLEQVLKAAERAAALTRQLLAFSRKQVLKPTALDLNAIVANTHKMLGRLIGENIEVVIRPDLRLGAAMADQGQIEQIILNLAVNARDAMPKGGTLTLETANVEFDASYAAAHLPVTPGSYVMLAVSDTGVGMDAETQQHIFEPFFTTKGEGQGTGLGLATVYGIVSQSGGHIHVSSEPGHGTTFRVCLPRVEAPATAAGTGVIPEPASGRETILLVEDNEALRSVTQLMLEERGYTVRATTNGEEALALAEAHEEAIHLLLTDVVMPRLGGWDLAERVRALRPEVRVLFMSGYTDGALSQHGVLEPGVRLLQKPFRTDQLAWAVRAALDSVPPPR